MRLATTAAVLVAAIAAGPAALADHDPTHGVLTHGIGPDIHAVSAGTPHPYPPGETYTFELAVEGAGRLAVHFERYEVEGFFDGFSNSCYGGETVITDGTTGLELERICGTYLRRADTYIEGNDFWTADYETGSLVLTFSTGDFFGSPYGFDIYEVASGGARPIVALPYSSRATVSLGPLGDATLDPFDPQRSTAFLSSGAGGGYAGVSANADASLEQGTFYDCSLFCTEREGSRLRANIQASAAGRSLAVGGSLVAPRDGEPEASLRCEVDGSACGG